MGFALKKAELKVWAFDTDPTAREMCKAMAVRNAVESRVVVGAHCGPQNCGRFRPPGGCWFSAIAKDLSETFSRPSCARICERMTF